MSQLPEFCNPIEAEKILKSTTNPKHKAQILLMLDAGLRVSEVTNLSWKDLDFRKRILKVQSLKKRDNDQPPRQIPMSERLYDSFAELVDKKGKSEGYVFANPKGAPPSRQSVNNLLRGIESKSPEIVRLHPHKLRHTFATNLRAQGAKIEDIRDLLGHEKTDTSLIYAHADPEELRRKIEASQPKKTWYQRAKIFLGLQNKRRRLQVITTDPRLLVGRINEVKQIEKLISKNISVIITGEIGVGKSHLLNNLKFDKPVLEIDDCKDFKKSVLGIILHLFQGDKLTAQKLIFADQTPDKIDAKVSKESLINLCLLLKQITEKNEYILKIGDLDSVTPSVVKALQVLKEHFVIITTSRAVKMENTSFLWDFDKIEIKPLSREDSLKLFHRLLVTEEIENLEFVRNKIYETSEGNPRIITELSERLLKEDFINGEITEEICNGYLGRQTKEIDMSIYLLLIFGSLVVLKYIGRETGEESFRFIGSCIMIVMLFARYFFNAVRRKNI